MILRANEINLAPNGPGVYLIFDKRGDIIYVGKSKSLRNRLQTHFHRSTPATKSRIIQQLAHQIQLIETETEAEALLLEFNLIQKHRPPLNSRQKDNKSFPYLKITTEERYPRVIVAREERSNNAIYLGPYANVKSLRKSLRFALKFFPVADCEVEISSEKGKRYARTCMRRKLGTCFAPCVKSVGREEYRLNIKRLIQFFSGELEPLILGLEKDMWELAERKEYEEAAKLRDTIQALRRTMQRQNVFLSSPISATIIAETTVSPQLIIIMELRDGKVVNSIELPISKKQNRKSWIPFILERLDNPPGNVVITEPNSPLWRYLKRDLTERGILLRAPKNTTEEELYNYALRNVMLSRKRLAQVRSGRETIKQQQRDLREIFGKNIRIIHCFDVSTLQGRHNVAASIVFDNGTPLKKKYRRYRSIIQHRQDDYKIIEEAVYRRYSKEDLPDLLLIDGGLGQVNAALQGLVRAGRSSSSLIVVGLAKKEEKLIFPDGTAKKLDMDRPGILLLRKIRDEAHRFAVTYHRRLRQKHNLKSILDEIKGIGPKRKRTILETFSSVEFIKREGVSPELLAEKAKIPLKLAIKIIDYIREEENLMT